MNEKDYHKLFSYSYWYGARNCEPAMFENRKRLADDFDLVTYKEVSADTWGILHCLDAGRIFDRVEIYRKRRGGIIVIISPYETPWDVDQFVKDAEMEMLLPLKFSKYLPLYSENCATFIAEFHNVNHFKQKLKMYIEKRRG